MQIDQPTRTDLSIFHHDEEQSVFHQLNYTTTDAGKFWLHQFFSNPLSNLKDIIETQRAIQIILENQHQWPDIITNGTIMVLEKFYDTTIDDIPRFPNTFNAAAYKLLRAPDFSIIKYTVGHYIDFLQGMRKIVDVLLSDNLPSILRKILDQTAQILNGTEIQQMLKGAPSKEKLSKSKILFFGAFIKYRFKSQLNQLIDLYGKLDALNSMATAIKRHHLQFPQFQESDQPLLKAHQLYHILLQSPVPYDVNLGRETNFIFLTGANMAGKSTFIKTVGIAVYLAHIGMGVPAADMQLSLFDGMLSNIQINDNVIKGESYFYNEVQRIKNTILKINDGKKWLILIDELFKGTNVQDAMKCSTTVIEGLVKMRNCLFVLSTHLYEIGTDLKKYPNIAFRFFETIVQDSQLKFSYQLKDGISNDRLGYLILQQEKVIDLLNTL